MAINFNSLPVNRPTNLPEPGTYYATIESADMKQPSDASKPPYLNIQLALQDQNGRNAGKIYDIIAESDKELIQYKVSRFLIALGLTNLGTFELADLVKIIKNKRLIVDVKQEEATDRFPAKAVVDVFKGSIYYPLSEATALFGTAGSDKVTLVTPEFDIADESLTINASDAADVHTADEDDF